MDLSEDAELAKLEEKGVKGRYVSVELLKELDNGKVEWRMATSSTPGGNIPSFVAESTMASTIAKVCCSCYPGLIFLLMFVYRTSPISCTGSTRCARSPRHLPRLPILERHFLVERI